MRPVSGGKLSGSPFALQVGRTEESLSVEFRTALRIEANRYQEVSMFVCRCTFAIHECVYVFVYTYMCMCIRVVKFTLSNSFTRTSAH